ncbi:MAG: hypothetical protein GF332_02110 [Candidatus Moranbacteria bacterium]|nr:hypothetical protein [Candidatus Moranbacteria bacterium]
MLDKLKKLHKMKKQMENIEVEEELNGIKIKMNGSMKVLGVKIKNKDDKNLEKNLRKAFNKTSKKVQSQMARDMMGQGGGLL